MKLENCTYEYLLIGRSPIQNSDESPSSSKNITPHIPVHTRPVSRFKHSAPHLLDLFTHLNGLINIVTKVGPGFVPLMFMIQESNLINSIAFLTILILLPTLNPLHQTDLRPMSQDFSPQLEIIKNGIGKEEQCFVLSKNKLRIYGF